MSSYENILGVAREQKAMIEGQARHMSELMAERDQLRAALREALNGWEHAERDIIVEHVDISMCTDRAAELAAACERSPEMQRIAALRAKWLP